MSFASLLNTLVTIERKSATKDASGGQVENFAAVPSLTNVPACVQARHGRAPTAQAQRQVVVTHVVYLADGSGVARGDRVYQPSTGKRFVTHGVEDMAGQGRAWRLECEEIT